MAGGKLKVLSLFAGIGGFDLGLERTGGFETVAFCEIDPFCRRVLAKHWPEVKQYGDVRELTADRLRADGIVPDVICGGFPCQDISDAGAKVGIAGERSGLWAEYARLIGELRPAFVIVENVAALLSRGLGRVLGDLASIGYDAEWHCIPASAVGAPHRRDRLWIVSYPNVSGSQCGAHSGVYPREASGGTRDGKPKRFRGARSPGALADTARELLDWRGAARAQRRFEPSNSGETLVDANGEQTQRPSIAWDERNPWHFEPDVGRVANGVPRRVDRLKSLGNAVVPQIPELIGRAILASIEEQAA